jgi:hypothetical protein
VSTYLSIYWALIDPLVDDKLTPLIRSCPSCMRSLCCRAINGHVLLWIATALQRAMDCYAPCYDCYKLARDAISSMKLLKCYHPKYGFADVRPMRRPCPSDARARPHAVSSTVWCVSEECHAPSILGLDCEETLAFRFDVLDGLSLFISLLTSLDC